MASGESTENKICSAELGANVEIEFQFTSNPPGTISLTFPSTLNSQVMDTTRIVITSINDFNAGEYQAEVTNTVKGSTRRSIFSLQLIVAEEIIGINTVTIIKRPFSSLLSGSY